MGQRHGEGASEDVHCVVVGAGVAGLCCVESILRQSSLARVTLVSPRTEAKRVENVRSVTRHAETFDVVERPIQWLCREDGLFAGRLEAIHDSVHSLDPAKKQVHLSRGTVLGFDRLCWAAGARPREIPGTREGVEAGRVVTLRDTDSVRGLAERLGWAQSVAIIGNGGIALELAGALLGSRQSVTWLAKHARIGNAFLDHDSATFLAKRAGISMPSSGDFSGSRGSSEMTSQVTSTREASGVPAGAVGPDWVKLLASAVGGATGEGKNIAVELEEEAVGVRVEQGGVRVGMSSGHEIAADICVVAAGVEPNVEAVARTGLATVDAEDGGLHVDRLMRVQGLEGSGVFSAGDSCTVSWANSFDDSPHWFQMRLWTQARTLGAFAGACMVGAADEEAMGYNLDVFAHTTRFLGQDVVLLGRYNAQGLGHLRDRLVSYCRETEEDFIRVTALDGRAIGAVLIGNTDLAETMENLIMTGLDISRYGAEMLDPDIDIEDYFD